MHVKSAESQSHPSGVVVWRGGNHIRCYLRHLTGFRITSFVANTLRFALQCDFIKHSHSKSRLRACKVILNHGQVTRTTPELAPTPLSELSHHTNEKPRMFNVHRPPLHGGSSGILGSNS
ncbi:hypothetical protein TNCV_4746131 [Trichonephila clavipes]|nr:hypothetical protein TNCV_1922361 [Trichonephila clavipes]GFV50496.1 hypothetical protein TNCV_4746131 [Trichonephila clavipes]